MSANRTVFLLIIAAALVVGATTAFTGIGVVKVEKESMMPTLSSGQWVLILRGEHRVRTGDIAVFVSPADGSLAVKRCVLAEGEPVDIEHGWLITKWGNWFLSGTQWERLKQTAYTPDNTVFLVGDNQFHSLDSRSYGFVPRKHLLGRVLLLRRNGSSNGR